MIVVDASVVVNALAHPGPSADRIARTELSAPHLLDIEVASGLRRMSAAGEIDPVHAALLLDIDAQFEITRYPHTGLLQRAWELRHNLSMYDAVYIALAEAIEIPLVTCDARMAGVPGSRAIVEVIPTA